MHTRASRRKLGPNSRKTDSGKEWKASKSTSHTQSIDTSLLHNSSYQMENVGHITPLPPPLVGISFISFMALDGRGGAGAEEN